MATKKPSHRSQKHDPEEVFVIQKMTRKEISVEVNDIITKEGWPVKKFSSDDERLTVEFCQAFADLNSDVACEIDEIVDKEYDFRRSFLREEFTQ